MTRTFKELGLRESLLSSLAEHEFHTPLEIQERCIPLILAGKDIVGLAETGSGKTLAYGLPLLQRVKEHEDSYGMHTHAGAPIGLALAPTRELAEQVSKVLKSMAHATKVRVRSVMGGTKRAQSSKAIAGAFEILVCTPGRLLSLMEAKKIKLDFCSFLVLDEADQLFEMGFLKDLDSILEAMASQKQLLMFSATLPKAVRALIQERFAEAEVIQSRAVHKPVDSLQVRQIQVSHRYKFEELCQQLDRLRGKGFVFTNSKGRCADVTAKLKELGQEQVACLHAGLERSERKDQLKSFREQGRVLVCTDLAARGLDIEDLNWIINYDMPQAPAQYLHRIGRTARTGRKGLVIDLVTPSDAAMIQKLRDRRVRKTQFQLDESPNQWSSGPKNKAKKDSSPRQGHGRGPRKGPNKGPGRGPGRGHSRGPSGRSSGRGGRGRR